MKKFVVVLAFMLAILSGCKKEESQSKPAQEQSQKVERRPLVISVKDIVQWQKEMNEEGVKVVAFVSNRLSGVEREAFLTSFQKVAKKYRGQARFIFVNCDQDELWAAYDRINPFNLRQIPLVAVLGPSGEVLEAYANPSEALMDRMVAKVMNFSQEGK